MDAASADRDLASSSGDLVMAAFNPNAMRVTGAVDRLLIVFGDQLDFNAVSIRELDKTRDAILMTEVAEESAVAFSHKQRTVLFFSAMRHFAIEAQKRGFRVHYVRLNDSDNTGAFESEIKRAVRRHKPAALACTEPGEWRVLSMIESVANEMNKSLTIHGDEHFLTSRDQFRDWMGDRKRPVLEYFYREQRRRLDILIDREGRPEGGQWNFDSQNRKALTNPPDLRRPYTPRIDSTTNNVIQLVERKLADNPGALDSFRWPVTRDQARRALDDFIEDRLALFGDYQDAMLRDKPLLFHSALSSALNLKLLNPRECVDAALASYESGDAPLNSVEGFIRQIIGWREFIRGVYWHEGPDYRERNELDHHGSLPPFYWTAETEMTCMRQSIGQVIERGYGHHIQRLMVTGNFALIAGVKPCKVNAWYLGMYVDAVDWVTSPNVLGMAMHADDGVVGTKPYAASGRYIQRMSNYCDACRFNPAKRYGPDACPFTTLYWDFLMRHQRRFRANSRMTMMLKNVERMDTGEKKRIRRHAESLKISLEVLSS